MSPARPRKHAPGHAATRGGSIAPDVPLFVFSRDAVRELDRLAADELSIPSILLMEHASLALARHAADMAREREAGVLIVCGKGNNAGDGLALARHLHLDARPVSVILAGTPDALSGDAGVNLAIARRLGIPIHPVDGADIERPARAAAADLAKGGVGLVVDAIFGTGIVGPPREPMAGLIRLVNAFAQQGAPVLAVDIPSGLDAETGRPLGDPADAVVANRTVTFVGLKRGFLAVEAQAYLGDVFVEPIGTPMSLSERLGERLREANHPGESDLSADQFDSPERVADRPGDRASAAGRGHPSKRRRAERG
jgi:hydroxyethylthiazole kinase-like uncharacterized protein yjeF